jgi:propionyl-CoA carboxylase beta chain
MHDVMPEAAVRRPMVENDEGARKVAAQHAKGKLTARERLEVLLDAGTFEEYGGRIVPATGSGPATPGDGVVTGWGTVAGRLVFVYAQDFTVRGGSVSETHARKICAILDMAVRAGAPVVGLNDSGGARIQDGVAALAGYGEIFRRNAGASGIVPQISVIMGPCAGGAVYSPALTDFIFMVRGTSYMFVTGPDVVRAVTGETISADALGGAGVHTQRSAVADAAFDTDVAALEAVRHLLGFLPQNNRQAPPDRAGMQTDAPPAPELDSLVPADPKQPYDMLDVIARIVDDGAFFQIADAFARQVLTGFARIEGRVVGVVANQPMVLAGCLDSDAARKAARFVRFCDAFNIPVLSLVDVPGFLPGVAQEHGGIIKHGAKLLFAYAEATVPLVTLITRKAYGGAYDVMASKHLGADVNFAWPTAQIAVMGAKGAVEILHRKDLGDPDKIARHVAEYERRFATPDPAAERGFIDEVIQPRDTRKHVARAFAMLSGKSVDPRWRKHDTMPQ